MDKRYSLYLIGQAARLVPVEHPILASAERFSSASYPAKDHYSHKAYWITPLAAIADGAHTFGGWRFTIKDGQLGKVRPMEED